MSKFIKFTLAATALAVSSLAQAATFQSFTTVAGQPFTQAFVVTPTTTNKLLLTAGGLDAFLGSVNITINGNNAIVGKNKNGSWNATFNDSFNGAFSYAGGVALSVLVSGTTKAGHAGLVTVSTSSTGTISPVPEPESFAMLLAGLGLMGAIAARRKKTTV